MMAFINGTEKTPGPNVRILIIVHPLKLSLEEILKMAEKKNKKNKKNVLETIVVVNLCCCNLALVN